MKLLENTSVMVEFFSNTNLKIMENNEIAVSSLGTVSFSGKTNSTQAAEEATYNLRD